MDRNQFRALVSLCRDCGTECFPAPRYGTGYVNAQLMLVGQNPPADKERSLHGGWMLHYPDQKKEVHEELIWELVQYLGLQLTDIYVTQAYKCSTPDNTTPILSLADKCAKKFLATEVRDINPKVILIFGGIAAHAVGAVFDHGSSEGYKTVYVEPIGGAIDQAVRHHDNIVQAPHPSVVGRFLNKKSWLEEIKLAVAQSGSRQRLLTHDERIDIMLLKDKYTGYRGPRFVLPQCSYPVNDEPCGGHTEWMYSPYPHEYICQKCHHRGYATERITTETP